ncbi:MAG: GNAT family N-acetyltransferase [Flavobacteriaceae bacterium]|nr:GNAT family N-acetyltransferase [Flavobacteriaceae bacterium]
MIEVREIRNQADMSKAFDIRRRVFVIEQECPPDEEYDTYEESSRHFLANFKGLPVGTCRFRTTQKGIKLERFAVLKAYRKTGIGAALLQNCLDIISKNMLGYDHSKSTQTTTSSVSTIYLHAQEHAMEFYTKYHFIAEGDRFYEAGIPHFAMRFTL